MPTDNSMISSRNYGLPYISYIFFDNNAQWHTLVGLQDYINLFFNNPVLYSVIMIKAREAANMRIKVVNRKSGEVELEDTRKEIPQRLYKLFNKPSPTKSRWEFFMERKIFREACGNSFVYGNWGSGYKPGNIMGLNSLVNAWPQYMEFKLTGKYFSATKIDDIISSWRFKFANNDFEWKPSEIMHSNAPVLDPTTGLIFGSPIAASLIKPLSNIDLAYETRNVLMKNRGMRAIISPEKGDDSGKIPLTDTEKNAVKEELKDYGTREKQQQLFFTHMPIKATMIDQDVMKLGLFEEIATDAQLVAIAFGVPEILVKLYLEGATFENQEASLKRLYQGTIIPEAEDDMIAFNTFLGLDDTEWRLEADFSHIAFLQKSKKDESIANKQTSEYYEKLFRAGAITHNQWLKALDIEEYKPGGERRITEFTPEELAIILMKPIVSEDKEDKVDEDKNKLKLLLSDVPKFGFSTNGNGDSKKLKDTVAELTDDAEKLKRKNAELQSKLNEANELLRRN